jgi:hypothetical protein
MELKGEIEMRTSEQITQNEIKAYAKFCAERGIIHDGSQDDQHNADFVLNYFVNIWKEDITEQNLNTAWEKIRPHLKFYAPNQQEANDLISKLSPEEQKVFAEWKGPRGLKPTHRAVAALLSWLGAHKFPVTKQNLDLAVGQQRVAPFLEWNESATPRHAPDPRQHQSDGTGFLGKNLNEPQWKRVQREREEREAAESKSGAPASAQSATAREAQRRAEELRGNTHSETEQLKKLFVTIPGTSEIDWPTTEAARLNLQMSLNKAQAVRRFIR